MKKILVTGVSSGIGFEICRYFIQKGYMAIGSVRKEVDAIRVKEQLGANFIPLIFDVRDITKTQDEISRIKPILEENGILLLVNNAGIAVPGPLEFIAEEDFEKQLDINVKSVRRITNLLLPYLGIDQRYPKGKIINISSVSGLFVSPFNAAYSISKFALEALTDGYRRELLPFGIKVIAVQPGPITTKIWNKNLGALKKYETTRYGDILKNADKMINEAEKSALPVIEVSKVIWKILNKRHPKTRYLVHKSPRIFKLFTNWLSDSIQDKLVFKTMQKGDKHRTI